MSLKASETSVRLQVQKSSLKEVYYVAGRQALKVMEENKSPYDGKQWGDTTVSGGDAIDKQGPRKLLQLQFVEPIRDAGD